MTSTQNPLQVFLDANNKIIIKTPEATISLPELGYLNLSASDPQWHNYKTSFNVGYTAGNFSVSDNLLDFPPSTSPTTLKNAFKALLHKPAPFLEAVDAGKIISNYGQTKVTGLGTVTHRIFAEHNLIINITEPDHLLHRGIVVRQAREENGQIKIYTNGIGVGKLPELNEALRNVVWGGVDYDLQQLLNQYGTKDIPNVLPGFDFSSTGTNIENKNYLGFNINHAFNSFSSLSTFESTSKIGNFSLSGSNTLNTLPTTNPIVKNFGFIIGNSSNHVSPLTFDLDGDGIESNHIYSQKVYFDIDADGFAEKVGWIKADDGQLAFDANKNGKIDDITELFGDDKEPAFDKLKRFETNKNGKIDAGDAKFGELLVWRDHSQDGKTNAGELKTLTETNIKEISLNEVKEQTYQNENYISGRAKYTLTNGTQRDIADVHFLNDNINTWFQGAQSQEFGNNFTIDPTTLLMPLSRGYDSLPSLHIAITQNANDNSVKCKLQNVA